MKTKRVLWIGIISSIIFSGIFLRTLYLTFDKPLRAADDEAYYYFLFDNNFTKLAEGDIGHLFDTRMFYPLKNTLAFGNSVLGPSILGLPVYMVTRNVIISANAVRIADFLLSFFFLYLVAYSLTGDIWGAFIAGLIYTYNPYMMSRWHQDLVAFQWVPLIFLATEKLLKRIRWRWTIVLVAAFLLQFITSFYYFFFLAILARVYRYPDVSDKSFFKELYDARCVVTGSRTHLLYGCVYPSVPCDAENVPSRERCGNSDLCRRLD